MVSYFIGFEYFLEVTDSYNTISLFGAFYTIIQPPQSLIKFFITIILSVKYKLNVLGLDNFPQTKFTKDVIVSFGKEQTIDKKAGEIKQSIFELSVDSWHGYINGLKNIDDIFIDTVKQKGTKIACVDSTGDEYSYYKFLTLSILFRDIISKNKEQNIGLLLPTTSIGAIMNIATLLASKTTVNLNYTSSKESLQSAVEQSNIKTIYTSSKFVKKLYEKGIEVGKFFDDNVELIYLEDLKSKISKFNYIKTYSFIRFSPTFLVKQIYQTNNTLNTTASILFSSGSEGTPKGIMLTHKNIIANMKQIIEMLNMKDEEVFLGNLPIFHAFGFTVTTMLPIVEGIKVVFHPDPTDAVGIGKAVAKNKVTFMCATATFIRLYTKNKKLTPIMFESLKYIFSGAEKLNPNVANEFKVKFSKEVLEGYGATECSPQISANVPNALDTSYWNTQIAKKDGTIGMPIPGCAVKIVDPNSLEELKTGEDGLIVVSGPNVMKGYLNNEAKTKEVLVQIADKTWYKTGDKGHIDEDGFITIVDRYSRFVKLGGEMISLTAIENKIYDMIGETDDIKLVCVNIPDDKKGEKIILVIDHKIENLKSKLLEFEMTPLWIPSEIKTVEQVPVLGSGKVDFKGAKELVLKSLAL